jgi:hypothetical protein
MTRPPTEAAFYRLKRAKYLVFNIYDATLKIIAVAKVKANIVIHICSSIAWQAGVRPVSQSPAPWAILVSLDGAAADDSSSMRLIPKTSETFVRHWQWLASVGARGGMLKKEFFRNRGAVAIEQIHT